MTVQLRHHYNFGRGTAKETRQKASGLLHYPKDNLELAKSEFFIMVVKLTMPLFNHEVVIGQMNLYHQI